MSSYSQHHGAAAQAALAAMRDEAAAASAKREALLAARDGTVVEAAEGEGPALRTYVTVSIKRALLPRIRALGEARGQHISDVLEAALDALEPSPNEAALAARSAQVEADFAQRFAILDTESIRSTNTGSVRDEQGYVHDVWMRNEIAVIGFDVNGDKHVATYSVEPRFGTEPRIHYVVKKEDLPR